MKKQFADKDHDHEEFYENKEHEHSDITLLFIIFGIFFVGWMVLSLIQGYEIDNLKSQFQEMPEWVCEEKYSYEIRNETDMFIDCFEEEGCGFLFVGAELVDCNREEKKCIFELKEQVCEMRERKW